MHSPEIHLDMQKAMLNDPGFPKVSIIMPTYNRAGYILEAIESVRNQTYRNWELLIVDDGSDDNTGEIVAALMDERIRFHKAGRIGRNGKIKNIGIEMTSGELIAFIDSDDLWAPFKIEKQVNALAGNPQASFSLTGGYNFREPGKPLEFFYKEKEGVQCGDIFISLFRSEVAVFAQVLLLRRECLAVAGMFKEVKSFSDVDFIIQLALHFKAVILYEPLVYRRLHSTNYISSNWEKSFHEGIEIIQYYKNKKLLPSATAKRSLFRLYVNFGEKYLGRKERRKAIGLFLKAWMVRPFSPVPFRKTGKAILSLL